MDTSSLTLIAIASSGAVYYVVYRIIFHQRLKWKMIHSIWLPLAVTGFGIVVALGLVMQPGSGGSMGDLAAIVTLMVFASPAFVFLMISLVVSFIDKLKKSQ